MLLKPLSESVPGIKVRIGIKVDPPHLQNIRIHFSDSGLGGDKDALEGGTMKVRHNMFQLTKLRNDLEIIGLLSNKFD